MKKVLILEDNFATAEYLKALVNEIDIKTFIFAFPHPAEGCRCALENDIDLFIVDIILDTGKPADSSGLKFVSQIRKMEKYSFTPVIFVTALEDSRLYTYEELHCYRFFEKPFDARELQEEIRYCLIYS
ncbi:MAG: PleD family two-component system response regulator, partial [Lachnospiraceae bacterium]